MVDHSRQLQGVLCALALGIGVNALCPVGLSLAFILTSGRMRRAEHQGLMQRVLNPNTQNLKQTLNLAGVVHHTRVSHGLADRGTQL